METEAPAPLGVKPEEELSTYDIDTSKLQHRTLATQA